MSLNVNNHNNANAVAGYALKSNGPNAEPTMQCNSQDTVTVAAGAADALPLYGTVIVTKAGVDAMTLASPTAGTDDGKILSVISTTANAHTITTAAGKINGTLHIATFAANVGSVAVFTAFGGVWYLRSQIGVTLS